ncbi:MAG: alpha-hydroxy-acid oxidizing protein [Desulfovibrio sp.]|nr:alpha-hydroxy-acid oxidizing protein [Desulfovibrio sp.]
MEKTIAVEQERRDFLKGAAVVGIGLAATPLLKGRAEAATAATPAPPAGKPKLTMAEVLRVAREKLYPRCRVCPECNGVACAGEVPGFGGIGSGQSFRNNYESLKRIQLNMRVLHDMKKPVMTVNIFGEDLALPVLSAATGGVTYNMGGKMQEEEYINAILGGCRDAKTLGLAADGIGDPLETFKRRMDVLKSAYNGKGIVILKPRAQEEILKRVRLMEEAGAVAFGMDIDSAGRAARALPGQTVEPKTLAQLKELVNATKLPFILKGVMTVDEAETAAQAGVKAIVVSNHGGRVLDYTPGVAEILPAIAAKVKGKVLIMADGAVRRGCDVLKLLALGADVCLVGRPLIRGAHGGGREGVTLMVNAIRQELMDAMVLTGVATVRDVPRSILAEA